MLYSFSLDTNIAHQKSRVIVILVCSPFQVAEAHVPSFIFDEFRTVL